MIRARIRTVTPNVVQMDDRKPPTFPSSLRPLLNEKMDMTQFETAVENFYMTDYITRESKIMAQCSAMLLK